MVANLLEAVFWDYPELTSEDRLSQFLRENRGLPSYIWSMTRFLERGRVVDTLHFFTLAEIAAHVDRLRLSPYTRKKWKRLLEVYGTEGE